MATIQKITTNLWFDSVAEEAVSFYTSVFEDSKIGRKTYYTETGREFHKKAPGTVMTIEFWLNGQPFIALNAGSEFKFNESISFIVNCDNQEEIDYYWDKLSEGGDPQAQVCGWLKDKFGLSWQIVPGMLTELMTSPDGEKAAKAGAAFFRMKKIDIQALRDATNS